MKLFSALVVFTTFGINSFSQDVHQSEIKVSDQFAKFAEAHPQEKVYLHFDKPFYLPGETIWYKAYLADANLHTPSLLSRIIYVELLDHTGEVINRQILKAGEGFANGEFQLPQSLPDGKYYMRAYTHWMKNFEQDYFFTKEIWVYPPQGEYTLTGADSAKTVTDLIFFPEGGNLVTGITSKVAFKAINSKGEGIHVKGEITDQDGHRIIPFESFHLGMGAFLLKPEKGKTYFAHLSIGGEATNRFKIPEALEEGLVLTVDNSSGEVILVNVRSNVTIINEHSGDVFILVQAAGKIYHTSGGNLSQGSSFDMAIPKKNLPSGIVQITLFNGEGNPECERLVFVNHHDDLRVSIETNKKSYYPREEVLLKLSVRDCNGNPVEGNFSLAVTDASQVIHPEKYKENILTCLLLGSELKGNIEQPAFYFIKENSNSETALDYLMLTHGWRRYLWKELLGEPWPALHYNMEKEVIHIKGQVVDPSNDTPLSLTMLSVLMLKDKKSFSRYTNQDGFLDFYIPATYGKESVFFDAADAGGNHRKFKIITENNFPEHHFAASDETSWVGPGINNCLSNRFVLTADYTIEMEKFNPFKTMSEVFREVVPYVSIVYKKGGNKLRVYSSEYMKRFDQSPLFFVDGLPTFNTTFVLNLDPGEVKTIEVINSIGKIRPFGFLGVNGVVGIHTKHGTTGLDDMTDHSVIDFQACYVSREFYSPGSNPDLRSLVYWNPMLKTDSNGEASVSFYNTDNITEFDIRTEGISDAGTPGVANQVYQTIPRKNALSPEFSEIHLSENLQNKLLTSEEPIATAPVETTTEQPENEIIVIGKSQNQVNGGVATISGYVREAGTGLGIIGSTVYVEELKRGTISNKYGYYSLTIPAGVYHITFSYIGLKKETKHIVLNASGIFNIELSEAPFQMEEVTITGEAADLNISGIQMSTIKLDMNVMETMPALLGEVDVIKSLTLLPSVSTVGEGASGFNVRGGETDQNLVLLDDAPIFNTSHAFGFFSVFHPDAVKNATLYSGGISAKYGGRLSSVLDIQQNEGNLKKFTGKGGVGLVSSRLAVEGPIVKDKCSFMIAGRTTYSDWILNEVPNINVQNSAVSFYDATAKINYAFNHKNKLSLSTYLSNDQFRLGLDTTYNWGTANAVIKYNHIWGEKLFSDFTAIYSNYDYKVINQAETNAFQLKYGIGYKSLKTDFTYFSQKHQLDFGAGIIFYTFQPGTMIPTTETSGINPVYLEEEQSREMAVYINDEYIINARITIMYGLRYSRFNNLGPADVYVYQDQIPKDQGTIVDTLHYSRGERIKTYGGFEPRVSVKLSLGPTSSLKISYNRMRQYISMISNTAAITPIDIWKTSNTHIRPQTGDQLIIGYFKNFTGNSIEASAEAYYKKINNLLEYKDGASLLLNETLEADLLEGKGRAYGIELMGKKKTGRLTGWTSYVYSRSERQVDGEFPEETINHGNYYPSNYDKPHNFKFVSNYRITQRWSFSANFIYGTGRPFTAPYSKYRIQNGLVNNLTVANFSQRNQFRIQDYHRLDISVTIGEGHKKYRKWKGSWTFSIYNVYGRKNAYSVFFKDEEGVPPMPYRLSVLGVPFPSLTYNFHF